MKSQVKPVISWPGGKRCLLEHILPMIPEHQSYIEPFCGGLAVFLAKQPVSHEVINDTHQELVRFYRCVKFHCGELEKELDFVLNSRAEFNDFVKQPGLTDIQQAARWLVRRKNGFADSVTSFGRSRLGGGAAFSSLEGKREAMRQLYQRFDKVCIESLDWKECVDLYDANEAFFFFDPPYITGKVNSYAPWSPEQMQALEKRVSRIKGRWLLTTCDSAASREIFRDYHQKPVLRNRGITTKGGPKQYGELIVSPVPFKS